MAVVTLLGPVRGQPAPEVESVASAAPQVSTAPNDRSDQPPKFKPSFGAPGVVELKPSMNLPVSRPPPSGRALPIFMSADELSGRLDRDAAARGDVQFRQGSLFIRADQMTYDIADDLARAQGQVRIERNGDVFTGPELQLKVNQFEGYFVNPTYFFALTQAGGKAQRVDFINDQRMLATGATYSSCPPDGSQDPPWLLSANRVQLKLDENEGIAEGAVLRFFGVPILAAPALSFPLTDARKSGWLPPSIDTDSRSGLQLAVPYYWNIAPQRDATFTPRIITRRGFGLDSEFRYLEPAYEGALRLNLLPDDRVTRTDRYGINASHASNALETTQYGLSLLRVSDDDYWKDFPRSIGSVTPRLLLSDARISRPWGDWTSYARVMKWQVLQGTDPLVRINDTPYERAPQVGLRTMQRFAGGVELAMEAEANHFVNPTGTLNPSRVTGTRAHTLVSLSRPWASPGWTLTPRLMLNAASYALDQNMTSGAWAGQRRAARVIPTFSADSQWVLERDARLFGRNLRQTLEPRLVYAYTPYKDQSGLPTFDSAAKDFNLTALYSDNVFSGIDRVSDANQVTMGVATRWLDPVYGVEVLRLGLAQRYLLRTQKITAEGTPSTRKLSDVYLDASTGLIPSVTLSSAVQYNPEIGRAVSYSSTGTYAPAPFKVLSGSYTGARGFSEQAAVAWQWPLFGPASTGERGSPLVRSGGTEGRACAGTVYAVGRVNYSLRDRRVTDSIIGFEYDAGCWVGRIVAERLSTGRSEANTRWHLQLELVGLSRLGSNPLQLLKDNVPGYRLLRDRAQPQPLSGPYD